MDFHEWAIRPLKGSVEVDQSALAPGQLGPVAEAPVVDIVAKLDELLGTTGTMARVSINRLAAVVEWKASATGMLSGHASVFGNVDEFGDVVLPGAFKRTIHDWRGARQPMPLVADHDKSVGGVIGSIVDLAEGRVGLNFRAVFSPTQKAQDVRKNDLEGHIKGLSFRYLPIRSRSGRHEGKSVRLLEELRLFEITVTPFPVNLLAAISAAS